MSVVAFSIITVFVLISVVIIIVLSGKDVDASADPSFPNFKMGDVSEVKTLEVAHNARSLPENQIPVRARTGQDTENSFEPYYDGRGRIVWLQKNMELQHAPGIAKRKWTNESLKIHTINKFSIIFDRVKPLVQAILNGAIGRVSADNLKKWFGGPGSLWTDPNPRVIPICQHANVDTYSEDGQRWGGTVKGQFIVITVPYYVEKKNRDLEAELALTMGSIYHEIGHVCDSPMPHDDLYYKKVVAINTLGYNMGITKYKHRNLNMGYGVQYDLNGNYISGKIDATVPRPV